MRGKSKGDDRNEKTIRYLLKQPENRRCINCNSLGPQYVCTTFWTFICTNCSGVHREFTHRVKSVSMAKFTDEEIDALQTRGNERARQTYLKTWDPGRNTLPQNSNINKLREFVKHVYEERRYTGDINRFTRMTTSEKKDDPYKHKYTERSSYDRDGDKNTHLSRDERSVQSLREYPRRGISPSEKIVDGKNDRIFRRSATEMFTTSDLAKDKFARLHADNRGVSSPPVSLSIREILGDDVPTIRVEVQPKAKQGKSHKTHALVENVAPPKKKASNNEVTTKNKSTNSESLIDFTTQEPPSQSSGTGDEVIPSSIPNEKEVSPNKGHHKNTLEYLLFELAPQTTHSPNADDPHTNPSTNESTLHNQDISCPTTPKSAPSQPIENEFTTSNVTLLPTKSVPILPGPPSSPKWMTQNTIQGSPQPRSSETTTSQGVNGSLFDLMTPIYASTSDSTSSSNKETTITKQNNDDFSSSHQCENFALVPYSSTHSQAQPPNQLAIVNHQPDTLNRNMYNVHKDSEATNSSSTTYSITTQSSPVQRKEIPSDFLNSLSSSGTRSSFPWMQNVPYNTMGYNTQYQYQYSPFTQGSSFANSQIRSTNPFDINNEFNQGLPNTFSSTTSLQGSPSNMSYPRDISPTNFGQQMPGAHMGQNSYNNTPQSRVQIEGISDNKGEMPMLGSIDVNQQPMYEHSTPTNQSPPPSRAGNPFA